VALHVVLQAGNLNALMINAQRAGIKVAVQVAASSSLGNAESSC